MPKGGPRPGQGRPRGSKNGAPSMAPEAEAAREAPSLGMTPLEYMLHVMRDPQADAARRDRMAQAAAPYLHPKAEPPKKPKAEEIAEAARDADKGTGWQSLLQ